MRPLFLEFKGLNSFSENTQIDFAPLLSGGIFGIFGETGSGKSTILDAINFALFGDIGRSTVKTDKINDKCESLDVKFTFDIYKEGSRRKYYVERSIKRKSGTHKAMLYELPESGSEGGKCLADNVKTVDACIVDIIGISEEDFKKCIALPQGEFAQFVKSAPSERTELIERLFSLQKYGENLKGKLFKLKYQKENEFNQLSGKLSAFEGVTKEKLKELENEAADLKDKELLLKENAKQAADNFVAQKKKLDDKNIYLSALQKLERLKADKPYYDGLFKVLSVLPDCTAAAELDKEIKQLENKITLAKKEEEHLDLISANKNALLANLNDKIIKSNYDGEYQRLSSLYGKMYALLPDAEKYENKAADLAVCRNKYKQRQRELEELEKAVTLLRTKLENAKKMLEKTPEPDIVDYFGKQIKGSILREQYAKNLCYIKDLQDGVNFFADGSALYDYISEELKNKAEEYKQLIISVNDAKVDVYGQLKLFNDKLKERRDAENQVKSCQSELEVALQKVQSARPALDDTAAEGNRIKKEWDELSAKLADVFGENKNYRQETVRIAELAEDVKKRQKADSEELKKAESEISACAVKLSAVRQSLQSDEERLAAAKNSLEQRLKNAGAGSAQECSETVNKYGDYNAALEKFNKFTADYASAEGEVARTKELYGGVEITEQAVKESEEQKIAAEKEYYTSFQDRAVKESEIKNFTQRFNEKKALDKDIEKLNGERDLIAQLDKLLRDNRFMKYIANEHLENISKTASKTLLQLTDGRYFLEYADNNFCVGDNYNGGNLRRVNTLSGGETFLVSLSLALALSDTICRRSLKSIEFFFLDEGFGTLDGDLIDTVIDALEKLKSSDFTIGLISHVDELKHRINNKILVSKATESHGSTVRISC